MTGDVHAREVVIGGTITGNVHATERVELQATAIVTGDIVTQTILVQEGGRGEWTRADASTRRRRLDGNTARERRRERSTAKPMSSAKRTPRYVDAIPGIRRRRADHVRRRHSTAPEPLGPALAADHEHWRGRGPCRSRVGQWQLLLVPPTPGAPTADIQRRALAGATRGSARWSRCSW
jgi:hypothetical protein